jgi:hypothetical protein
VRWPVDCVTTDSLTLVESLVAEGDRVSIVSRMQTLLHNGWRIKAVGLNGAGSRTVGMKWRRGTPLSPLGLQLVRLSHEASRFATAELPVRHR